MTAPTTKTSFYADFASLSALKRDAKADGQKALRETAQQFESLFTQMMLKSMRSATPGDAISKSSEMDFYQGMYDQQLAVQLSKGKGLGLADMLVQQLTRSGMVSGHSGPDKIDTDKPVATTTDKASTLTMPGKSQPGTLKQNIAFGKSSATPTSAVTGSTSSAPDTHHRETLTRLLQSMGSAQGGDMDELLNQALPLLQSRYKSSLQIEPVSQDSQDSQDPLANISSDAATKTGSVTPTATDHGKARPPSRDDFVRELWPHAQQAASKLGVDPSTLIAHAALETGWGKHVPCNADGSSSFNLFGIKAGSAWSGNATHARTHEVDQGLSVQRVEKFRSYSSPSECFDDYASMLGASPRYAAARDSGGNSHQFAQALQKGGYATDPKYASKLQSVIASVKSLLTGSTSTQVVSAQVTSKPAVSAGRGVS